MEGSVRGLFRDIIPAFV